MLLGHASQGAITLRLRGSHPLRRGLPAHLDFSNSCSLPTGPAEPVQTHPTTPRRQHLPALTPTRFSLLRFRSPLLTESQLFSLPAGTEMFHFPAFPPTALYIQTAATGHNSGQVSPFGHPRITARLPTPRGISQAPTTFIGSRCQGIHHAPSAACQTPTTNHTQTHKQQNKRCSRPLYSSQTTPNHTATRGRAIDPSQPNNAPPNPRPRAPNKHGNSLERR